MGFSRQSFQNCRKDFCWSLRSGREGRVMPWENRVTETSVISKRVCNLSASGNSHRTGEFLVKKTEREKSEVKPREKNENCGCYAFLFRTVWPSRWSKKPASQ